jgi:hypothetical protein
VNDYKGYISTEHTLWCGNCAHWVSESSDTKAVMAFYGRKRGWKKTKEMGWVCPSCAKDLPKNGTLLAPKKEKNSG